MACTISSTPKKKCNFLNIAGVGQIYFIPVDDIDWLSWSVSAGIVTSIPKIATKVFKEFNCNTNQSELTVDFEYDTITETGYREAMLDTWLVDLGATLLEATKTYETGVHLIAVVETEKGEKFIIGEQFAPLVCYKSQLKTGKKQKGQTSQKTMSFSAKNLKTELIEYTGTMVALLT